MLTELAKGGRVIAPSHPGFGTSQLPKGMTSVDDVSYFYLDLLEALDLHDVLVVGVGLGGWIAAEIAVKDSSAGCRASSWPTPSASRSATARPATSSTSGR